MSKTFILLKWYWFCNQGTRVQSEKFLLIACLSQSVQKDWYIRKDNKFVFNSYLVDRNYWWFTLKIFKHEFVKTETINS